MKIVNKIVGETVTSPWKLGSSILCDTGDLYRVVLINDNYGLLDEKNNYIIEDILPTIAELQEKYEDADNQLVECELHVLTEV